MALITEGLRILTHFSRMNVHPYPSIRFGTVNVRDVGNVKTSIICRNVGLCCIKDTGLIWVSPTNSSEDQDLSHDVASGSDITLCNKICKPLVVYRFTGNVMTSITTLRTQ